MVTRDSFGALPDGRRVELFRISNNNGLEVSVINWGGIITSLLAPDQDGAAGDVVLGYDDLEGYLSCRSYFGALIGRYANRIALGRFSIDGETFQLAANDGRNHLHGGIRGFDKRLWEAHEIRTPTGEGVVLSRVSEDGEEGYPGRLRVSVHYLVAEENELRVDYHAEADAPTIVNLTQHSYFNLAADSADTVLDHRLTINADAFTPVNSELLPTGAIVPVAGTPFDFRQAKAIGLHIGDADEQLSFGQGYDHNWIIRRTNELSHAATLMDAGSGRVLDVFTTAPGIQFYSGNQLDGRVVGKEQRPYRKHAGLCLETQLFPDSPNHRAFPSSLLRPTGSFRSRTLFRFGIAAS